MEKELPPPDSMASVTIKPDYAPSESYSSEPPPAYQRPKSAAVQVAKIIAVTVVLVSMVLGGCILASAYITANASCRHLEQELQLLTESMDRYQPLQPEALIQEEPQQKQTAEPLAVEETKASKAVEENSVNQESESQDSSEENSDSNSSEESEEDERIPIQIKLPLQLDFDDLAGAMMDKNQRSKMNCFVEKKKAEEVVDHQPKTVNLPFGVNITTDPRYERVSGERIAIFCESGHFQRAEPQDQEETIMIQPVMIPLPPPQFHTHMPMQAQPQQQQQQQPQMHPMETMRPPMPNQLIQMQLIQQQIQQRQQYLQQQQLQQQQQLFQQQQQQLQQEQEEEQQQRQPQITHLPPSQILHHIAQQIIAQKLQQEAERSQEEVQSNEVRPDQDQNARTVKTQQRLTRIPLPEDILTQIDRLPNRDVIVAVSHHEPEAEVEAEDDRQSYARGIPVNIPVPIMQQEQDSSSSNSKETREHFVHPRSIRSVENLLPKSQKRVKRCNCDCAC